MKNLTLILLLAAPACGAGKTAPSARQPVEDTSGEPCCCEYVNEVPVEDDVVEEMAQEMLPAQECADKGGSCTMSGACAPETE
jgi:hypothetical protein